MLRLAAIVVGVSVAVLSSSDSADSQGLPLVPRRESGAGVTPAFEGWYQNPDGSFTFLFGYLNRNLKEALDIPVGPQNRVEPGGPDQGQPTHFLPVGPTEPRPIGIFAVVVPKDFGNKKLTWTLTAHEETNEVPARLHPDYVITPLGELAQGNTPPAVNFQQGGPSHIGPPHQVNASLTAIAAEAIELTLWALKKPPQFASFRSAEDASVLVQWSKYRGPGTVTFSNATPEVRKTDGKATTTARFQDPGDYILRVQASTASDRGSNQCCRTNALVRVTVSAGRN